MWRLIFSDFIDGIKDIINISCGGSNKEETMAEEALWEEAIWASTGGEGETTTT
jgi:hypothetical protein